MKRILALCALLIVVSGCNIFRHAPSKTPMTQTPPVASESSESQVKKEAVPAEEATAPTDEEVAPEESTAPTDEEETADVPSTKETIQDGTVYIVNEKYVSEKEVHYTLTAVDGSTAKPSITIPEGYRLVTFETQVTPTFLILQHDQDLFAMNVASGKMQSILASLPDGALRNDPKNTEEAIVYPSISENDQFFIEIQAHDPTEEGGMGGYTVTSQRTYLYDASANILVKTTDVTTDACFEYDSAHERFFEWPCGEGVGNTVPLSTVSVDGTEKKEIVSQDMVGIKENDYSRSALLSYADGIFTITIIENDTADENGVRHSILKEIILVNPSSSTPTPKHFTMSKAATATFAEREDTCRGDFSLYSTVYDADTATLVVGEANCITLLHLSGTEIADMTFIPEPAIYANYMMLLDGKVYYRSSGDSLEGMLKELDLTSQKVRDIAMSQGIQARILLQGARK